MKRPLAYIIKSWVTDSTPVHGTLCEIDKIRVINLKFNLNTHCSIDGSCEPNGGS